MMNLTESEVETLEAILNAAADIGEDDTLIQAAATIIGRLRRAAMAVETEEITVERAWDILRENLTPKGIRHLIEIAAQTLAEENLKP